MRKINCGSMKESSYSYWSGVPEGNHDESGVCFVIAILFTVKSELLKAINDRPMTLCLQLANNRHVSVCASVLQRSNREKETFYTSLNNIVAVVEIHRTSFRSPEDQLFR